MLQRTILSGKRWKPLKQKGRTMTDSEVKRRAYTVKDFCKAFCISHTQVYEMFKSGELASVKIGGRRLIPADVAEALLKPKGD